MNKYLKQGEKLPGEEVLHVIPYKPFSVLIITNLRILGKKLLPIGPKRFEGAIFYSDIVKLEYFPGISLFTTPGLSLAHRLKDGTVETVKIRFPGYTSRLAGYKPKDVYFFIHKQSEAKKTSNSSK